MKAFVRKVVEKSPAFCRLAIRFGNRIKTECNEFNVTNFHFQKNSVLMCGNENVFHCAQNSYFRNCVIYIKGKENKVEVGNTTLFGSHSSIHFDGNDNQLIIGNNCIVNNSSFFIHGNHNRIYIGSLCRFMETKVHIEGQKNTVRIGDGCTFHGRTPYPITLFSDEGSSITINDDAMLAHGIRIRSTDSHCIYDYNGKRLNSPEPVEIGKHCWIGLDVVLLKGAQIPNNCVVAARAVCTTKYVDEHCILAGVPAKVVKKDINWERDLVSDGDR